MKILVKTITKIFKPEITFRFEEKLHIYFNDMKCESFTFSGIYNYWRGNSSIRTNIGEMDNIITTFEPDGNLVFFVSCKLSAIKIFVEELRGLYKLNYHFVIFDVRELHIPYMDFVKWFSEARMEFKITRIEGYHCNNDLHRPENVLRNLNFSTELQIMGLFSVFDFSGISNWIIYNEELIIQSVRWLGIDNLFSFLSVTARFVDIQFTDLHINTFLQHVIDGGHPNLQFFEVLEKRAFDINGNLNRKEIAPSNGNFAPGKFIIKAVFGLYLENKSMV